MERVIFEIILEQREEEQKADRNVATSQRRDVGSTRRGSQQVANVVTPQRRDVSAISASPSLKVKGTRFQGKSEIRTDKGTKSRGQRTRSLEKTVAFIFSSFLKDC